MVLGKGKDPKEVKKFWPDEGKKEDGN